MRLFVPSLTLCAVSALALAACKSESTTAPGASADGPGGQQELGAPSVPWPDKTFEQRQEWMGLQVLPRMKATFQGVQAGAFPDFKCQTCHGDDMEAQKFAMPSDEIMALNAEDPVGQAMEYDEDVTKFMLEQVVPQMAELLSTTPYDPQTGQGFGCFGCHTQE